MQRLMAKGSVVYLYLEHLSELPVCKCSTYQHSVFSSGIQDTFFSVYVQMFAPLAVYRLL